MSIYKPTDRREAKRSLIVLIIVLVVAVVVIGLVIGMATREKEIKFTADGTGTYLVTLTYMDGAGMHQSQYSRTGHYEVKITGATTANLIVMCDSGTATVKAYIDGRLVDSQSGSYAMVSATP
jgi:flagellar basal body-associated protein FliL